MSGFWQILMEQLSPSLVASCCAMVVAQLKLESAPTTAPSVAAPTPTAATNLAPPAHGLVEALRSSTLTSDERRQVMEISECVGPESSAALTRLIHRSYFAAPMLRQRDSEGHTLLENLHSLATRQELHPALQNHRSDLVADLIRTVADPSSGEQVTQFSCSAASLQFVQTTHAPAEWARLVAALSSPQGQADLRNGDRISVNADSVQAVGSGTLALEPNRPMSSAAAQSLFQAAVMEHIKGPAAAYDLASDSYVGGDRNKGALVEHLPKLLTDFCGEDFAVMRFERASKQALATQSVPEQVMTELRLNQDRYHEALSTIAERKHLAPVSIITELYQRDGNAQLTGAPINAGQHIMIVAGKQGDDFIIFDPSHTVGNPLGAENAERGLRRIPEKNFPVALVVLRDTDNVGETMTARELRRLVEQGRKQNE